MQASFTALKEFIFFISEIGVLNSTPLSMIFRLTFASQRRAPSSMFPSVTPINFKISLIVCIYFAASSGVDISGFETISIRGTPERLKSI